MPNALTTDFTYEYPGTIATDFFYKPAVMAPDVRSLFRVRTDVRWKENFHIINPIARMIVADPGCGTRQDTASASIGSKAFEVCNGFFRVSQCADAFEQEVIEELTREGIDFFDLQGTAIAGIIQRLLRDAMTRDIFRTFSFGDPDISLDNEDLEAYYNWCTGMWPSLLAGVEDYSIHQEDEITSLSQTTGQRSLDYLENLYVNAPRLLRQWAGAKQFAVTQNVYDNLQKTYEQTTFVNGLTARTENGVTRLSYRGIPVNPYMAWDEAIEVDGLGNNVRIAFMATDNQIVGLLNAADQAKVQQWYDPLTGYNYWQGRPRLGYQYIHDELQAISVGNVT